MDQENIQSLSRCSLFSHKRALELEEFFARVQCSVKKYHKNAIIAFRGDRYEALMILLKGEIAGEIQDPRGKTVKIETLRGPCPIAAAVLFADNNRLPVSMRVEKECRILVVSKSVTLKLCREDETFLRNLLADGGNKITFLAEKLRLSQFTTIEQKLAGYLLNQRESQAADAVSLDISKETLSEIFGVTRPSLSRVFSEMTSRGILKQEGKIVHLLNIAELEEALETIE